MFAFRFGNRRDERLSWIVILVGGDQHGDPIARLEPRQHDLRGIGPGVASPPRIQMAPDPDDDKMYIKTSKGQVITIDPPPRPPLGSSVIYWKQNQ